VLISQQAQQTQQAQQQQQPPQAQTDRAKQRLQEIKERLQITPEQMEQLRPVLLDEFQKMKAVRDKYGDGNQRRREKMKMARELKSIQNDTDEKLKTILSKQQMEELKKLREEWREQFRERAGQR
jgi:hypothetical protein